MIENGIAPSGILLLTFTNKAADEMKERAGRMDERCEDILACTYHSFCAMQLRKYAKYIGFTSAYSILTPADTTSCIDIVKTQLGLEKIKKFPKSKEIAAVLSASVNKEKPLEGLIENDKKLYPYKEEVLRIIEGYKNYKKEHDMMDYDDILALSLKLLVENPKVAEVIEKEYPYIMVDEAQDSNVLQEKIIGEIRKNIQNISIVGDVNQSLYKFRGADIENFMRFPKRFPDCKTIVLDKNYRSTQPILDLANGVLEKHSTEGIKTVMKSGKEGEKPLLMSMQNRKIEAEYVLSEIKRLREEGTPYSEIGVLFQMSYQSFDLETLLNQYNIPYSKRGGLKFLERSFVVDVLSFLRVIANPVDELAWFRVLKLFEGIGDTYAQRLAEIAIEKKHCLLIDNPYSTYKFANDLKDFKSNIDKWLDDNLQTILDEVIYYYGQLRLRAIETLDEEEAETQRSILKEDIEQLQFLKDYAQGFKDLSSYIDSFALDAAIEEEAEGVVLSTIHSAKGLEWDNVFVLDCVDGICPKTKVVDAGTPEDNEYLRCFYVAITRPRKKLTLLAPQEVRLFGGEVNYVYPSHFLDGLKNCFDKGEFNYDARIYA